MPAYAARHCAGLWPWASNALGHMCGEPASAQPMARRSRYASKASMKGGEGQRSSHRIGMGHMTCTVMGIGLACCANFRPAFGLLSADSLTLLELE